MHVHAPPKIGIFILQNGRPPNNLFLNICLHLEWGNNKKCSELRELILNLEHEYYTSLVPFPGLVKYNRNRTIYMWTLITRVKINNETYESMSI